MFGKESKIKKFPYLAYSPNIIEYFAIIGYPEKIIPQILDSGASQNGIKYSPTLLSFINSNTDFGLIDNELIIGQVYPDIPLPIKKEENMDIPSPSSVIYSFCFDTTDGKDKLFHVCFAYKYYEKYTYGQFGDYYIPKAFVIISQYNYFTLFKYICEFLYNLIYDKRNKINTIPLEIVIYNIVNFIPSPINYELHLNIFDGCCDEGVVQLGILSGYPYLQFDLCEIFNLLPLNMILEIYIFSVLEQSILFFSSNLEILNMVMFIIYTLNYPCNDSPYFWHIVSVSEKNFVEENKYVGKIMVSMLGVNTTYREDIDTSVFEKYHFVVDIDNKKFFLKKAIEDLDDEEEDYNKLQNLFLYIENIFKDIDKDKDKEKKNPDSIFLKQFIQRIKKFLESFLKKTIPEFNGKNKYVDFFRTSKDIMNNNKIIQELFYDFCLNILMVFYQENILNSTFEKLIKDKDEECEKRIKIITNLKDEIQMDKDEKEFCRLYRKAIKYKIYFENFIRNSDSIEIFKIPLIFSEEFINIKTKDPSNKIINRLSLFTIIDSLYSNNKPQILNITLNNIISEYHETLKNYFKHLFVEEKNKKCEESKKPISDKNNKIRNQRQLFVLNKKIINKYIYLLNNIYEAEELSELFPSIQIQKEYIITKINRSCMINTIQNSLEKQNLLDLIDYLIYALVIIYAISFPLHSYEKMLCYLEKLISSLGKAKFFIRQHTYILIKSLYKFYLINKKQGIYPQINYPNVKMFYYMLNIFIKKKLIIPNDEIMSILSEFFDKTINKENEINGSKIANINNNDDKFQIEKGKNFICFMKHCFTSKKTFKSNTMIKAAMKENKSCNIVISTSKKKLQPTVEIKINEYIYSSEFFAPKKIYKLIQSTFNQFFDKDELGMSKLKVKDVRDVISNLIQYGLELNNQNNEIIPIEFLVHTLYLFKDHEKKYGINNK